jgi:hypothetical protein
MVDLENVDFLVEEKISISLQKSPHALATKCNFEK